MSPGTATMAEFPSDMDHRFPEDEFPRTIPEDDSRGQSLMSEETVIYRVTSAVDDAWRARMVRTAKRLANCR